MREGKQRANWIEQIEGRPRPGRNHDQIAERKRRHEQQNTSTKKTRCGYQPHRLRKMQRNSDRHIKKDKQSERALAQRSSEQQPKAQQMQQARTRQVTRGAK